MALDRSFVELNRASTARIRALAAGLDSTQLQHRVGEHWTVAITLIHLAFWERRVLDGLAKTEQAGALAFPPIDFVVNDLSLPFWAAVPPADGGAAWPSSLPPPSIRGWKTIRRHCSRKSTRAMSTGWCAPATATPTSTRWTQH